MRYITPLEAAGEFHVAIYDFKNWNIYLAGVTLVDEEGHYTPAYERAYMKVDLKSLYTMKLPE